ncbi:MAG TPA: hypothetical protein VGI64_22020 [Streptosporangiaceae bacterium]|jgi:hypothetical protein
MQFRPRLLGCLLAAALAAAGCGASSGANGGTTRGAGSPAPSGAGQGSPAPGPAALLRQMRAAVQSATSVHVTGQLVADGRPLALDLGMHSSGQLAGTITTQGVPLTIIDTGGKGYVKATPAFLALLRQSPAVCKLICGKYVLTTGAKEEQLTSSLGMRSLLGALTRRQSPAITSAGTTTVNGAAARVLRGADGSTLAVAARGAPYPLRVTAAPARGREGSLEFSQWNSVPLPAAPPAAKVIDLRQLER